MTKEDKEWSAEDESEPEKVQREMLHMGKEMLARMKKEEEDRLKAQKFEEPAGQIAFASYSPPTFAQISAKCEKCWTEVRRLVSSNAPEAIQVAIFQHLMMAPDKE